MKIQDFFRTFSAPWKQEKPVTHLAKLQPPELF